MEQIRSLAIAVNSSPQRLERFKQLQEIHRPLQPIQDVRTRWNSTYDMLLRAWTLRSIINQWIRRETEPRLALLKIQSDEWTQIKYLILLLKPFRLWTEVLSESKGATIHKAWFVYNLVTGHMLRLQNLLEQKDFAWKDHIVKALEKGLKKLMDYRGKATGEEALIYTLATVLDPSVRLSQFSVSLPGKG